MRTRLMVPGEALVIAPTILRHVRLRLLAKSLADLQDHLVLEGVDLARLMVPGEAFAIALTILRNVRLRLLAKRPRRPSIVS